MPALKSVRREISLAPAPSASRIVSSTGKAGPLFAMPQRPLGPSAAHKWFLASAILLQLVWLVVLAWLAFSA